MSRSTIIVLISGTALAVGVATWMVFEAEPFATEAVTSGSQTDVGKHQRADDFFGGDPDRSIRGGQEMKPRW